MLKNKSRGNTYAALSLILLFLYYTIDRWIPLGDWNGNHYWPVHNDQFYLDLIVGAILLGAIVSFRLEFKMGMTLSGALLGLWTFLHLQTWWIPYVRGVTSPQAIAFYQQFSAHTQVLPKYDNRFPPDAEHTFIDIFLFPAFAFCIAALARGVFAKPHRINGS